MQHVAGGELAERGGRRDDVDVQAQRPGDERGRSRPRRGSSASRRGHAHSAPGSRFVPASSTAQVLPSAERLDRDDGHREVDGVGDERAPRLEHEAAGEAGGVQRVGDRRRVGVRRRRGRGGDAAADVDRVDAAELGGQPGQRSSRPARGRPAPWPSRPGRSPPACRRAGGAELRAVKSVETRWTCSTSSVRPRSRARRPAATTCAGAMPKRLGVPSGPGRPTRSPTRATPASAEALELRRAVGDDERPVGGGPRQQRVRLGRPVDRDRAHRRCRRRRARARTRRRTRPRRPRRRRRRRAGTPSCGWSCRSRRSRPVPARPRRRPRRAQAGQPLARPVDVGEPQRRAVLGEQRGDAHDGGRARIVAARSIARGVPLLSSSAATGSRQRPEAASAIASGSIVAQVLHRPRVGPRQVQPQRRRRARRAHAVAGVGGDAAREQRDHELLRRDARARRVQRAGQPAHRRGRQLEAVDAGQRRLQVGEVAAHDALRVGEVVARRAAPRARRAGR